MLRVLYDKPKLRKRDTAIKQDSTQLVIYNWLLAYIAGGHYVDAYNCGDHTEETMVTQGYRVHIIVCSAGYYSDIFISLKDNTYPDHFTKDDKCGLWQRAAFFTAKETVVLQWWWVDYSCLAWHV